MSRSGYSDDIDDQWQFIRWRGAVKSAIRGKRGQSFLKEMLRALDALPEHKLIRDDLEKDGAVCAIGAVGKARGIDMTGVDPEDYEAVASLFDLPHALTQEIVWMNDEAFWRPTPEERYAKMRAWVEGHIHEPTSVTSGK